ncbi:unnamed protein product [Rotaria sp. Silwood1]|nr:unnamed protein product [Rotaria sp. Silwood1]CAF5029838.1 unnamed protein product [Rotaria sp. Silwood1]
MINTDRPFSTAIDNEESIYISSISSSKLKKYGKRVTNGRVLMSGEVGPFPLTVDRVFQIDEGRTNISIVIGGSEHIGTHQLSKPPSVAVDESGALYITEWNNHRITQWLSGSTDGIVIVSDRGLGSHSDQLHGPTDLGFDSEGNLYVVDSVNRRIQNFLIDNGSCQ